ncbi:MAG: polyphenol oxidase family protein [Acidimicrobiales bacterium]
MPAVVLLSGAEDGDLGPNSGLESRALGSRRELLAPGRWRWVSQVHSNRVVVLDPDERCEGREADALVTTLPGDPVAVFAADCALVGLVSPGGVVAAAHVGWRGLLAGILEATAAAMRSKGATDLVAVVGPCIGPECYEFGADDLRSLEARYGSSLCAATSAGRPALDLRAGVHRALESSSIPVLGEEPSCTACGPGWFSWRARGDTARQALVVAEAR